MSAGGTCCPSRRGEWWLRLSINAEHLGRPVDALELAETALADDYLSNGDRLALQRRVLRLGERACLRVQGSTHSCSARLLWRACSQATSALEAAAMGRGGTVGASRSAH